MAQPLTLRLSIAVFALIAALAPMRLPLSAADEQPSRILVEAEHLHVSEPGWQPIGVGQGNYFVDTIGAAHYSGAMALRLPAIGGPFAAYTDVAVVESGAYRVWARYDFPWRDASARFRIRIEQDEATVFEQSYGEVRASRIWFFNLPDAPWQDLQHGVEGPVSEAHDAFLHSGSARITLLGEPVSELAADRVLDFIFLTTDTTDDFRRRGERLYPLLDEISRAEPERLFGRITNPPEATSDLSLEGQYTFNRAPWRSPAIQIGAHGALRGNTRGSISPGESSPWMNLTCQDTTHPCHLHLRARASGSVPPTIDLSSAPDEGKLLRRLVLTDLDAESVISIPPYPSKRPEGIRTMTEVLQSIVGALEASTPAGSPPRRFLVFAGLGDNLERRLDDRTTVSDLLRKSFFLTGANAFNNLNLSALPAELASSTMEARETPRFFTYGDYRWFPTPERVEKAQRDIGAASAWPALRGFTLGDEINISDWYPRGEEGDALFREAMLARGETPEALGAADWTGVHVDGTASAATSTPRLFVRSRKFLDDYALLQLRSGVDRVRAAFGPEVLIGANFSPHPDFRPDVATFVRTLREGGLTLASHSDYWWQASEIGPESTGFLVDAFRAGLRDKQGMIQPYVMPHSPGNTDRDFKLGLWTAIIHGARSVDLFRIGPEQINTVNYISSEDLDRYRAVQESLYLLGPAEDTLMEGETPSTTVGLVLSESTDRWETITPARGPGIPEDTKLLSQASNTERKGLWQALRHAHVSVDMLTEDDLASDIVDRYRVLYLAGPELSSVASQGLVHWIECGGTLVSVAGAGTLDEFSSPDTTLSAAQGVAQRSLRMDETILRPRVEVPRLRPLDRLTAITDTATSFDAVAWRESLVPVPDAQTLARFEDGTVAVTLHTYGSGRAITVGTLPGTAYLRSGVTPPAPLPDRGPFMHQPLTAYDATLRQFITRWATDSIPARASASDPLVEIGLAETPSRIVIPLANFGAQPTEVQLNVPGAGTVSDVSSVRLGALPFTLSDSDLIVQVPLDTIDMLIVDRASP
jgi:hypothetical protein